MSEYIASIYNYVYIIIVAILTFLYLPRYKTQVNLNVANINQPSRTPYLLLLCLVLFIGFRPHSERYFCDMVAYSYNLRLLAGSVFEFNFDTYNVIFDNLLPWWASLNLEEWTFFTMMATLYFVCAYCGLRRLFPNYSSIAFLVFLAALSTFSYSVNGMKAGVAASVFILALGYMDKKILCFALMLVSLGFHHSMIMPIVAFLVVLIIRRPKLFYYFWVFCLLMACLHITYFQHLFAGLSDEQGVLYLTATPLSTDAYMGFRPDFIIYSAIPVLIGYKFEFLKPYALSARCKHLIHFYIMTNSIWLLCMYASFNNRIAYLSWFVYPIVVILPYLDKGNTDPQRYLKFCNVVKYHLFFTLFMVLVYYGFWGR